ncbi:OmpA family protein [Rheinheimera metallidurans]|uniref:OmpA family protein n=1 Tax=Rheinheimera metallidurans TaxID=2925781 RepID=UPI0030028858
MSSLMRFQRTLVSAALLSVLVVGCSSTAKRPDGADNLRQQLTQLQSDPELAVQAPLAIKDAEQAVKIAEQPEKNSALAEHRVIMAERKITLARTLAQTRQLEQQREALTQKRDEVRLNARSREAASARTDAQQARMQTSSAQADAAAARGDTRLAMQQASAAEAVAEELRGQIDELNARPTDRGLVVTLGDVLFDTGKANLKSASSSHLNKLAVFLMAYPGRTAQIEGHTDNVGNDGANMLLSQRRAESVKAYLVAQGVMGARLATSGKGEGSPLASNDSAEGRQQNRRVEVIIANATE